MAAVAPDLQLRYVVVVDDQNTTSSRAIPEVHWLSLGVVNGRVLSNVNCCQIDPASWIVAYKTRRAHSIEHLPESLCRNKPDYPQSGGCNFYCYPAMRVCDSIDSIGAREGWDGQETADSKRRGLHVFLHAHALALEVRGRADAGVRVDPDVLVAESARGVYGDPDEAAVAARVQHHESGKRNSDASNSACLPCLRNVSTGIIGRKLSATLSTATEPSCNS